MKSDACCRCSLLVVLLFIDHNAIIVRARKEGDLLQQHFDTVFTTGKKLKKNKRAKYSFGIARKLINYLYPSEEEKDAQQPINTDRSLSDSYRDDDAFYKQLYNGNHTSSYNATVAQSNAYGAANNNDDAAGDVNDDATAVVVDDLVAFDNEMCSQFLISFLEGTTDARDTCEGIMNAFTAAECRSKNYDVEHNDYDDYFNDFTEHQCCQALQSHHSDYCEEDNLLSNFHLFITVTVLLLCECAKAAVTKLHINFLPEAAVCILVGTSVGLLAPLLPNTSIDDLSFDDELFLSLLLPPIIFEAALSVSKVEFRRRRGAIFMFSVLGTLISTFTTGLMVHYASKLSKATTFPMLDSLVFGALISSIDPVAILSVLTSLQMDQKDTIFILIFGESLLNDGIAITVFQTLVARFQGKTNDATTSVDEVLDAAATFLITMFGSITVGLGCGCLAWGYFNLLGSQLPPVMEVGSFFLWAVMPYYICDGVGWSGIVAIVAVGFFMDVYIAGPKSHHYASSPMHLDGGHSGSRPTSPAADHRLPSRAQQQQQQQENEANSNPEYYRNMQDYCGKECDNDDFDDYTHDLSVASLPTAHSISPLPSTERIHLSATADRHVRFVAHLTSQIAENAIFAYLGLFLFSNNYDWNPSLISIAIVSCVLSRSFMVVAVSYLIFHVYRCRGVRSSGTNSSRTAAAIQEPRTQVVLILAGLRGAVSLALVENVPIYNNTTGEGCEFKQTMKGMTSACILFTTFVFGGGAFYVLPHLGIKRDDFAGGSVCSTTPSPRHRTIAMPQIPKRGDHEQPQHIDDDDDDENNNNDSSYRIHNPTVTIT